MSRIDFGGETWAAHRQQHWGDLAGKPYFPDYLRVVFVAYHLHRANGHARLQRGDLAGFLVRADGTLPNRRSVFRAIDQAVTYGFLLPESRALCLVVSSEHVQGGKGDPNERCLRDHTIRKAKDNTSRSPSLTNDYGRTGRSSAKDYTSSSRSTLTPFASSPHPVRQDRDPHRERPAS